MKQPLDAPSFLPHFVGLEFGQSEVGVVPFLDFSFVALKLSTFSV